MATVLSNENKTLEFTFDDDWQVWAWDELPAYLDGIRNLDETKAVDFLGLHRARDLYFIEVKDCRVDPTSNKSRVGGPLAIEVGQKTRDTIAGIAGAHRTTDPGWQSIMDILADRDSDLHVVLWLELIPTNPTGGRRSRLVQTAPASASIMQSALKAKMNWLGGRSRVVSLQSNSLPGVVVRNLPGAGMPAVIGAGDSK